jgi:glycogen operon protein
MPQFATRPGSRFPPGATAYADGVNFCVFSRHATRVDLLLFADAAAPDPFQTIALHPDYNRTFSFWHVFIVGLRPGIHYNWRTDGPADAQRSGFAFNARKSARLCRQAAIGSSSAVLIERPHALPGRRNGITTPSQFVT